MSEPSVQDELPSAPPRHPAVAPGPHRGRGRIGPARGQGAQRRGPQGASPHPTGSQPDLTPTAPAVGALASDAPPCHPRDGRR